MGFFLSRELQREVSNIRGHENIWGAGLHVHCSDQAPFRGKPPATLQLKGNNNHDNKVPSSVIAPLSFPLSGSGNSILDSPSNFKPRLLGKRMSSLEMVQAEPSSDSLYRNSLKPLFCFWPKASSYFPTNLSIRLWRKLYVRL